MKDDIEYDTRLCFDTHRTMEGPVKFEGLGFAVSGHNKHGNPKAIVVQFDEDGKIRCATMVEVP